MSEYQSYEFLALDRPLDERQQAALRKLSTRARITPWSFSNVYNWGDFRGDPQALVRQYFDVFAYFANWGTNWCMFRVPLVKELEQGWEPYADEEVCCFWPTETHLVLELRVEEEDPSGEWYGDDAGEQAIGGLAGIRADLLHGDLRPPFIGWLAAVGLYEHEDEEAAPPIPGGLAELTAAQEALVDFLKVDRDLLAAAAEHSPPAPAISRRTDLEQWLEQRSDAEKDEWLRKLVLGDTQAALLAITNEATETGVWPVGEFPGTIGDLRARVEIVRAERQRREAEERDKARRRREAETARKREVYLTVMTGREFELWESVEIIAAGKKWPDYPLAAQMLVDLQELARRAGDLTRFEELLGEFRIRHSNRPKLLERIDEAGLWAAR